MATVIGGVGAGLRVDDAVLRETDRGHRRHGPVRLAALGRGRPRRGHPLGLGPLGPFQISAVEAAIADIAVAVHAAAWRAHPLRSHPRRGAPGARPSGPPATPGGHAARHRARTSWPTARTPARPLRHRQRRARLDARGDRCRRWRRQDADGEAMPPAPLTGQGHRLERSAARPRTRCASRWTSSARSCVEPEHPRLVELEEDLWWLRDPRDLAAAKQPLSERVEWGIFSLLTTSGGISRALVRRARQPPLPRSRDRRTPSWWRPAWRATAAGRRPRMASSAATNRCSAAMPSTARWWACSTDFAHRAGMRVWIAKREQRRRYARRTAGRPAQRSRAARLPAAGGARVRRRCSRRSTASGTCAARVPSCSTWSGRPSLDEPVLKRGPRIETNDNIVRFLVVPDERTPLLRLRLERSPVLRRRLERRQLAYPQVEQRAPPARQPAGRPLGPEPAAGARPRGRARRGPDGHVHQVSARCAKTRPEVRRVRR